LELISPLVRKVLPLTPVEKKREMKKLFLMVLITAGCAFQGQCQEAANRVGYADIQYIISQLPDVKEIETELKSTQTQFQNQLQSRTQALQKQYNDFNANMNTMVDSVVVNKQRELEQAISELEVFEQEARVTIQNKQKLYMAPVYLKVNSAIAQVAKEQGFAVILTDKVSNYPFLLYQQPQLDVSDLVLQKFGVTPTVK
jgi:outer membrane protein